MGILIAIGIIVLLYIAIDLSMRWILPAGCLDPEEV